MKTNVILTQFKRELWEHRKGFVRTPLVVTLMYLALIVAIALFAIPQDGKVDIQIDQEHIQLKAPPGTSPTASPMTGFSLLVAQVKNEPAFFSKVIRGTTYINFALVSMVLLVVMLAYAHSCLFDDRKNREILFWRSMPVSETTNVLVKLGFLFAAAPLVMFGINMALSLLVSIVGVVFFVCKGVAFGELLHAVFHDGGITTPFSILANSVVGLFALLPVAGYFLFCSALAKKSPVLTSSLIPIVLVALDKILQVILGINIHVIETMVAYGNFLSLAFSPENSLHLQIGSFALISQWFLVLAIGSAFVAAAIWLRNHRYEI